MSDKARTVSDVAVRKAGRERLLRDFARAARLIGVCDRDVFGMRVSPAYHKACVLTLADNETSRTRYACLMTAFGL